MTNNDDKMGGCPKLAETIFSGIATRSIRIKSKSDTRLGCAVVVLLFLSFTFMLVVSGLLLGKYVAESETLKRLAIIEEQIEAWDAAWTSTNVEISNEFKSIWFAVERLESTPLSDHARAVDYVEAMAPELVR